MLFITRSAPHPPYSADMDCALQLNARCPHASGECPYHSFIALSADRGYNPAELPLLEIRKRLFVYPPNQKGAKQARSDVMLMPVGKLTINRIDNSLAKDAVARARVVKFLRLIDHLGTAPWANMHFDVNHKILLRLTASHLSLIAPASSQNLCHLIDYESTLEGAQNLVWVTNRQQGKTTTLARFVAALAIACPLGGLLFTIYSTSLDRSVELVKASKKYLYWLQSPEGRSPDYTITVDRDNERMFAVNNGYAVNEVYARPKNPDSCRGDAPRAAIFDEIGFISRKFWQEFAFPLLQVGQRVFTCATTPPAPTSFFSSFIATVKERNAQNDNFFLLINHSLTCATCLENGEATECSHNLMYLPPWKSLVTLNQMSALAANKETFQMEVYGIISGTGNEYIPRKLIDASLQRAEVEDIGTVNHVWVAIDPASHGVSDFAGCAFTVNNSGMHTVIGLFNVNMNRCQTTEIQYVVHQFLQRLRGIVPASAIFVPIIECNNNEILSMSILRVFESYGNFIVAFEQSRFESCITPEVGVWMTHSNKMGAIQCAYQAFLDGRVCFSRNMVLADRTAYVSSAGTMTTHELKEMFAKQLASMQDQPDGKISGKHAGNDDLASAFLIGIYWCMAVRASWQEESLA